MGEQRLLVFVRNSNMKEQKMNSWEKPKDWKKKKKQEGKNRKRQMKLMIWKKYLDWIQTKKSQKWSSRSYEGIQT